MNKFSTFILALASPAMFAINGPTTAPTGWDMYLRMGATGDLVNTGGRFDAYLSNSPVPTGNTAQDIAARAAVEANMWCVDSQLQFTWNTSYRANSLGFSEINGESTTRPSSTTQVNSPNQTPWTAGQRDIRYEDVLGYDTNNSTDSFKYQLRDNSNTVVTTNDGALFRYRMAAYLLDQYEAFGAPGTFASASNLGTTTVLADNDSRFGQGKYDPKGPNSSARNTAIIKAIWAAMDTTGDGDTVNAPTANADVNSWFKAAVTYVETNWNNASKWAKWAVVSAWVNDCGTSNNEPCYVRNSNGSGDANRVQTFLTERAVPPPVRDVPEPGFYGVMAIGVSGLFWAVSRRRNNEAA